MDVQGLHRRADRQPGAAGAQGELVLVAPDEHLALHVADPLEHRPPDQRAVEQGDGARHQPVHRARHQAVGVAGALHGKGQGGAVLRRQNQRADHGQAVMPRLGQQLRQRAGLWDAVVVGAPDPAGAQLQRCGEGGVIGAGGADVGLPDHQKLRHRRPLLGQPLRGAVAGAVVHHDDAVGPRLLPMDGRQTGLQQGQTVVGDHHRDDRSLPGRFPGPFLGSGVQRPGRLGF